MHSRAKLRRSRPLLALAATAALLALGGPFSAAAQAGAPVTITNYSDPGQAMKWGNRSHWKQPWRSYLDTVPAATLVNALGINFNIPAKWAEPTARMLASNGFKRARVEFGWNTIDYEHP